MSGMTKYPCFLWEGLEFEWRSPEYRGLAGGERPRDWSGYSRVAGREFFAALPPYAAPRRAVASREYERTPTHCRMRCSCSPS